MVDPTTASRARGAEVRVFAPPDEEFSERLATDPILVPWPEPSYGGVVQTGAWTKDERPHASELEAFLEAGAAPVAVGFGRMPMRAATDAAGMVRTDAAAVAARLLLEGSCR
ncbi:hypothetical protein E1218_23450 [Kribbella turkmenica]|uniref:Uncharacterized protein n=1 Tax=Kribbella turkmenica TaxID=2530375 RepID=A0A4R4WP54_9ACTN|nr:hypothetical protein [Kribbella turkmenica]TDD19817.1 hypothetical protein E1218_23450 [Kribbella turkmenica]